MGKSVQFSALSFQEAVGESGANDEFVMLNAEWAILKS